MTSSPPDSRPSLRGLPGGPVFGRSESGERPSWRAIAAADRELDAAAPARLRKALPTQADIAKRRSKAALDDAVYEAGNQLRLADLAGLSEKNIREWIELEQRNVPLHLVFRVPDHIALVFVRHVIRHWGRRALYELRRACDELLGDAAEDGPVRRAM